MGREWQRDGNVWHPCLVNSAAAVEQSGVIRVQGGHDPLFGALAGRVNVTLGTPVLF